MPAHVELVLDFETASAADLKKVGSWRYSEDITTEILCLCWATPHGAAGTWKPGDPLDDLRALAEDPNVVFIAHNAAFEKAIWRNIMVLVFGLPDVPDARWHDTMAVCAMKSLPQDLDRAALVLRLPHQKDKEGNALVKRLSKPDRKGYFDRSPATIARVVEYCGRDVSAQGGLHARVGWLPPGERRIWLLDQRVNQRGVRLDLEFISAARRIVDKATVPLAAEFREITGGLEFTQRDKVLAWVEKQGVYLPNMTKETLAEVLGLKEDDEDDAGEDGSGDRGVDLPADVRRALHIRQLVGSASVKKLARMEQCVCQDGRARGLLQYHGAGPGRWAGRLLQPQNFPRGTLEFDDGDDGRGGRKKRGARVDELVAAILTGDPAWVEALFGPPVEAVVSGLRHAIVASKARALVAGDFAQIEARVLLAIAGQWDKVELLASGGDPYNDMASVIYGRPIDRKNGDAAEGQVGKNSVLGLGFQMGAQKFMDKYGNGQDLEFFQHVVRSYREEWAPNVPKVWYGLEEAALKTAWEKTPHEAYGVEYRLEDGWMTARLPSGRKLWYWNPQPARKAMPWDHTDVRPAWTYQAMKMGQWKTIDAYGGLLTENVVQGSARDLMAHAMLLAEKEGFPVVLTVHDEVVTEPEEWAADHKTLEQLMADVPQWARELRIPVKAEGWAGSRYKK